MGKKIIVASVSNETAEQAQELQKVIDIKTGQKLKELKEKEVKPKADISNAPTIEQIQKILLKQLADINRKKELADNRELFISKRDYLQNLKTALMEDVRAGNFEQAKCKISFSQTVSNYRDDEKFTISNTDLVIFFIERLLEKIEEKIINIESQLIA